MSAASPPVSPASPTLRVLYRDEWLVVVSKPSGVAVHRGWAQEGPMALELVRDAVGRYVFPVHRLDRATSGALLFALDAPTAAHCGALFAASRVEKTYIALVRGAAPEHQVVDHPLRPEHGEERVSAVTEIRRLAVSPLERCSLVEAKPRTGRLHQIRRHLKHLSHPIVGDVRYGKGDVNRHYRSAYGLHRLALHASRLRLPHPVSGASLDVRAPISDDLGAAFTLLGFAGEY